MNRYITAAGLGAVTGLRSMRGLAALSREYGGRRVPRRAGWLRRSLARDRVADTLSIMAWGEMAADKIPGIHDRIDAGPLVGRAAIGGLIGGLVAGDDHPVAGIAAGAAGAVVGAFAGWLARREAGRARLVPDSVIATAEDALAVFAAARLAREA